MNVGNYRQQLEAIKRRNKIMKDADKMFAVAIGDFLRRRRLEKNLKLRHIAEATGLSIARIYNIEMGAGKLLDDATFQKFLKAVNIKPFDRQAI
jgi:predicted transcriptional regulator